MAVRTSSYTATFTTSTGAHAAVGFGLPVRVVTVNFNNATTKAFTYTIQGAVGLGPFVNISAAATTSASTGAILKSSTLGHVVTQARLHLSVNATTGTLTEVFFTGV